jgi:hypothetical protein
MSVSFFKKTFILKKFNYKRLTKQFSQMEKSLGWVLTQGVTDYLTIRLLEVIHYPCPPPQLTLLRRTLIPH